ncbi:MAG: triose-phosphate isomerase [Planctomycetia bacterium]|nr:triose-phosphate isomerase [Planctomycetia bacterium]
MRKKFVAGNWKMNPTTANDVVRLATEVIVGLKDESRVTVAVCPPFPYLGLLDTLLKQHQSSILLGAQNCYVEKDGAFTGEISPAMLLDAGCKYVILGHSERRHKMGESDGFINQKVKAALAAGLEVILCVGETLREREGNQTDAVLDRQVTQGLADVKDIAKLVIAYEPVWAIGTGKNATPQQAQDAHAFIRQRVGKLYSDAVAQALLIQYGGSVKPDNAATLLGQPDVDGALVGGAALKADQFLPIVRAGVH